MADVELLPLPEADGFMESFDAYGCPVGTEDAWAEETVKAYARACVEHHTAPLQAENERLRAEVVSERNLKADAIHACALANIRADDLAEALRELVDVFSESGMYDEEVFAKARSVLAANVTSKEN